MKIINIVSYIKQYAGGPQRGFAKKAPVFLLLFIGLVACEPKEKTTGDKRSAAAIKPDSNIQGSPIKEEVIAPPEEHMFGVEIEEISKDQFYSAKQRESMDKALEKITDFETVQKRLSGIVEFEAGEGYLGIKKINFRSGTLAANIDQLSECAFVAYFPVEDILLLEGGHTTDVSLDLTTGQGTYVVGNPDLATTSPGGKYRLSKVFEGQECFYHFLQEKKQGRFQKVFELNEIFEKKKKRWLCVIEKEFWTDDNTLYFGLLTQYKEEGNEYDYYRVKIIDR